MLDSDPRNGGPVDRVELAERLGHPLPDTAEAITGGGGRHAHFTCTGPVSTLKLDKGIDLSADGHYVVMPPSLHRSGKRYEVDGVDGAKAFLRTAPAPQWLLDKIGAASSNGNGVGRVLPAKIPKSKQHDSLVSFAGTMRNRGAEFPEIFAALIVFNETRCTEPGPEGNIRKIAESICKKAPGRIFTARSEHPAPETQPIAAPAPEPPPAGADAAPPSGTAPDLPLICVTDRQLRYKSADALAALQQANVPPSLFVRSGSMVSIGRDEKGRKVIRPVSEAGLCGWLTRSGDYHKIVKGKDVQCSPPIDVVRDILALDRWQWKFQPLEGIIEAPVLRPDGSILDTPGYDAATRLYYSPDPDLWIPEIPEHPTQADVEAAVDLIWQCIGQFPFVDDASRANAYAVLLTPPTRAAVNAPVPLALLDSPQAGTGKTLLADVVSIIPSGRAGEMFSMPKDPDEWRKQITMALMSGTSVVVIDNVNHRLDNSDLCKLLTETQHADRAFRTHDKILLPVKSTWVCTGNNIQLGGDMPRRCFWVRLDAKTSRPFLRTGFAISDLKQWTAQHRGELLGSVLTLARAWYAAGKPAPHLTPLGSYESWSVTVGGILEYAGIGGFLGNAEALYEEADVESIQWENFLLTLNEEFYSEPFTVAGIVETLKLKTWDSETRESMPTERSAALRAALPDYIGECIDREGSFQRRTGKCFSERVDRRFGESQVHLKRDTLSHGYQQWRIVLPGGSK